MPPSWVIVSINAGVCNASAVCSGAKPPAHAESTAQSCEIDPEREKAHGVSVYLNITVQCSYVYPVAINSLGPSGLQQIL